MAIEQDMIDALIQHQIYAHRASTKVVNELNAEFVTASNSFASRLRDLLDDLTDAEKEALTLGKYTTDTLKEVKAAFDDWYTVVYTQLPETFAVSAIALATYEAAYVSKLYGEAIELSGKSIINKSKNELVVNGRTVKSIWGELANRIVWDEAFYAVTQGVSQGLTTSQIVNSIRGTRTKVGNKYEYVGGIVQQSSSKIESTVRTIRSQISQVTYEETFKALGFGYVKDIVTLDGRTSSTCQGVSARDLIQPIDNIKYKPPYHFRCRTVQIGCDKDGKIDGKRPFVADTRSVKDIPKDERTDKIGQVDANTTYPKWFAKQSAEFQKEVLGKTKYELYKKGGVGLDKFVDPLNKPYTIAELRNLDSATFKRLGL